MFVIFSKRLLVPFNYTNIFDFLLQDWLAFSQGIAQLTFQGKLQFENGGAPLELDNFAFCKVMIISCYFVFVFTYELLKAIKKQISAGNE